MTSNTVVSLLRSLKFNKLLALTIFAVILLVTFLSATTAGALQKRDQTIAVTAAAERISDDFIRQISTWLILPDAATDYFEITGNPEPDEMQKFQSRLKSNYPAVQFATYVKRITRDERSQHVSYMRSLGISDYEIRDLTPNMEFVKSSIRPDYYPVNVPSLEGWDIGADPRLHPIIDMLRVYDRPIVKIFDHPLGLVRGFGIVAFYPVFEASSIRKTSQHQPPQLAGLFIISLDPAIAVRAATSDLEGQMEYDFLIDSDNETDSAVDSLYKSAEFDANTRPVHEKSISVMGEVLTLRVKGAPGLQGHWPTWLHAVIPAVTATIALLIGTVILILVQQRKDQIEVTQQLRKMAKVKDRFLSTISHELKTPLTSIMAFADILKKNRLGHLDKKELNHLEAISRNSTHLDFLIDDFLEVSHINSGSIRLAPETFEVRQFMSELQDDFEPVLLEKSQSLVVTMNFVDAWLSADRHRVEQVLSNLISNASKYSDAGSTIWLTVSVLHGQLHIVVRDIGIGISTEDLHHVGTPFFRVDSEQGRKVGGTGLGVYVTKTIVELHGGTFEISSELGKGTSVTLRFPNAGGFQRDTGLIGGLPALHHESRPNTKDDSPVLEIAIGLMKSISILNTNDPSKLSDPEASNHE